MVKNHAFIKSLSFTFVLLGLAFVALGFTYSSGASAAVVLRGTDGGATSGDRKFAWDKTCVNTATRQPVACTGNLNPPAGPGNAPTIGYLYERLANGSYQKTGTCWNRSPLSNKEVACSTATGFISSSFSHHGFRIEGGGIEGGDITVFLGEIDPNNQLISVEPGAFGAPTVVTISMPDVLVKGFNTNGTPTPGDDTFAGQARFSFKVVYTIQIATGDLNKGGGNDRACGKCDPQNPKKGSSCTTCQVNQTCTDLGGGESQFTVKAFCQPGVTVDGELKLLPGETPPAFPGCTASTCTLKVGGLPLNSNDTVNATACAQIFDLVPDKLALKQMLSFQQNYVGACVSTTLADFGLESPTGTKLGLHRECHSDSFDGVARGCVVVDNNVHVAEGGEAARFIAVTVDLKPESVNLKCDAGKDSGVATVSICTTAEFNAIDVDTATPDLPFLIVAGDTACAGGKPCRVPAKSFSQGDTCGDLRTDFNFKFLTCAADGKSGLAQAIRSAKLPGVPVAGDLVPVTLQGTASNRTVVIQGTDDAKVVNP